MPFLTVRVKGCEGYTRFDLGKDRTVVGRASACDLAVPTTNISREHCLLVKREDGWWVEDLNSSNGTYVNKLKLAGPRKLEEKDVVKAGAARLTFHAGDISQVEALAVEARRHSEAADDADDPPLPPVDGLASAAACPACGLWVSTAHRPRGEAVVCPRCQRNVPAG
jgi:predicted component of type VI protein secretion system